MWIKRNACRDRLIFFTPVTVDNLMYAMFGIPGLFKNFHLENVGKYKVGAAQICILVRITSMQFFQDIILL